MTQENRFDFEKVLMLPNPGVAMHEALEELERCYRLRNAIRNTLSDYDLDELIRDVPEDEWNFEQHALVKIGALIKFNKASE